MKVAILGTSAVEQAVAEAFLQIGYEVMVYDPDSDQTSQLVKKGAVTVKTPEEAILETDAILLTITDGKAIRELLSTGIL